MSTRMITKTFLLLSSVSLMITVIIVTQYDLSTRSAIYSIRRDDIIDVSGDRTREASRAALARENLMRIVYWSNRDIWSFGNTTHQRTCGGYTCEFTLDRDLYNISDVAVIDVHRLRFFGGLPHWRPDRQKWAFLMIETPLRQFTKLDGDADKFNFSITYKLDSDVPLPYGQCDGLDLEEQAAFVPQENYTAGKDRPVAWFVSNCDDTDSLRRRYAQELQRYIDVDIYGKCGTLQCDRSLGAYCQQGLLNKRYKFYLSFENSFCEEYVTEKLWDILSLNVVPVVLGAADYKTTLPPRSYIDIRDFASPRHLAKYLMILDQNQTLYNEYFVWKRQYRCKTYLQEFTCKLCEYVHRHRDDLQRIEDIHEYWNVRDCIPPDKFYQNLF